MEHPILFLVKLFELIGLGDFAHHYPHVIYSWFVMLILIVLMGIGARGVSIIPGKAPTFQSLPPYSSISLCAIL
jgi:F-type H+-transporting ATPase subunit a